jgi:hypothetical protein
MGLNPPPQSGLKSSRRTGLNPVPEWVQIQSQNGFKSRFWMTVSRFQILLGAILGTFWELFKAKSRFGRIVLCFEAVLGLSRDRLGAGIGCSRINCCFLKMEPKSCQCSFILGSIFGAICGHMIIRCFDQFWEVILGSVGARIRLKRTVMASRGSEATNTWTCQRHTIKQSVI